MSQARRPQPSTDLRHDAARRRAVAGHLAEHAGEARDRPAARPAGRRRDRGRLPDHLAGRLRGRAGDRPDVEGPVIAGLARTHVADIDAAWNAVKDAAAPADPHVHLHLGHPHRPPAADHARGRQGPGPGGRRPRQAVRRRRRVLADGRHPRRRSSSPPRCARSRSTRARRTINIPDTVGYTMPHEFTGLSGAALRAGPGPARRRALGPLPRRPRAGGGQLVRRPAGRRAPGRVRDQRDRRAGRQRLARGDRDAAAHAPAPTSGCTPAR